MQTSSWLARLENAHSEDEVVMITRAFLEGWTPEELAAVPEHCRPGRIADGDDITDLALRLARVHCLPEQGTPGARSTERLNSFFRIAAMRLAQVHGGKAPGLIA